MLLIGLVWSQIQFEDDITNFILAHFWQLSKVRYDEESQGWRKKTPPAKCVDRILKLLISRFFTSKLLFKVIIHKSRSDQLL